MTYVVTVETVRPELIAAVRAKATISDIAQAWKPALDQVWAFLKDNPDLPREHNLFLYHHPARRDDPMDIDFGVQVGRRFEPQGNVRCVETPAGMVAKTIHRGRYDQLKGAHDAIHGWCAANNRRIGNASWEIYGDPSPDPAKQETTICYLLA
jgi:effector-binding domain-containing protein